MIRRAEVRRKAAEKGVPERSIEHDYCLSWLLIAIGSDDFLLERLVLKGGTCLRKIYFPGWRYSDDLDFTALRTAEPARLVEGLARACGTLRNEAGIDARLEMVPLDPRQTLSCEVAYVGPLQRTGQAGRIKIDISLDEVVLTPSLLRGLLLEYSDQVGLAASVRAYTLEEILAEKIRSMLQRTEPREFYDAWRILEEPSADFSVDDLREMVVEKCIRKGLRFEGFGQLLNDERTLRFRRSWEERLRHQLADLPPFEKVARELRRRLRAMAEPFDR